MIDVYPVPSGAAGSFTISWEAVIMRNILLTILMILSVFSTVSYAQPSRGISSTKLNVESIEIAEPEALEVEAVGNTTCPVSGREIDPETGVSYEHGGKLYNFCSPKCINKFKADPGECIAILE